MNPNAAKVVAALRSGQYAQTKYRLRSKDGYCCLGVACDIFLKETGQGQWKWSETSGCYAFVLDGIMTYTELPEEVTDWVGFQDATGNYNDVSSLLGNNDRGDTFQEIANTIEAAPEGLFII